ncbi:phosphatidate cytidylyltransferase [Afifella marina]|uniref:Phosphatidate cytidylyltransferase n=1 Tax=Afifella marina DSM 2698 TaxID=1120955 RepID=A0A1G5NLJ3_AFIMA|nr:phosphatidate cytidylyltransferase [Afifella marina]MBK1623670.1 CDP-archaeol synthase [Afifella marina DSM 2698]MBK1626663.1 CDP-archaeol synthase [Afifella marina]MBK5916212.1 hypothetical protein [Afifella marina]RAI21591.1 hypothetical protein CH311_06130 [Afifella marina DSM 2698]SCZ37611.1 phosphatidate cytidylyltransferase [Afifella marina DSM 2698]
MSEGRGIFSFDKSDLPTRVVSAAILLPLAILPTWFGGIAFLLLVLVLALLVFYEWTRMSECEQPQAWRIGEGLLLAFALLVTFGGLPGGGILLLLLPLVAVPLVASGTVLFDQGVASGQSAGVRDRRPLWLALGVLYAGVPSVALLALRADAETGRLVLFFLLFVVWVTDIAAYFGGRAIGGKKLWPRVSPSKTWSGAATGAAGALVVGILFAVFTESRWASAIGAALILSVAAQLGDLGESAMKRRFGAKDSGRLIPGHGGLMDRIDGLYAAAVVAVLLALSGFAAPIPDWTQ